MRRRVVRWAVACLCAAEMVHAQDFKVGHHTVQVHGFASQGLVYTDQNNWLTMNTSQGSGAITDMGLNMSSQLTDKFRVGAQVYDRNLGQLGQWHPSLDWATADYRFANWFGIRAGKVKTTLGLYNDSQDLEFLHVFALLPQGVYPADMRDATIAHAGGDVYGTFALGKRFGDVSYTAYVGHRSDSIYSGYPYLLSQWSTYISGMGGLQYGGDLRWNTPVHGLVAGISRINQDISVEGTYLDPFDPGAGLKPYFESSRQDWTNQYYAQYAISRFAFDAEYRRYLRDQLILNGSTVDITDVRTWYVAGTWRLSKRLKLGSYYSHYTVTDVYGGALSEQGEPNLTDRSEPGNHVYDKVISARLDVNRFWDLKIEGHFIDGYASTGYPAGFYPMQNPAGFKTNTNALVVRTGFHF
jgi:hypothetical protein